MLWKRVTIMTIIITNIKLKYYTFNKGYVVI